MNSAFNTHDERKLSVEFPVCTKTKFSCLQFFRMCLGITVFYITKLDLNNFCFMR